MRQIFEIVDSGQDGSDKTRVAFVADNSLAERVACYENGQPFVGMGSRKVVPLNVYESFEELPEDEKAFIKKREISLEGQSHQRAKEILRDMPTDVQEALKKILNQV